MSKIVFLQTKIRSTVLAHQTRRDFVASKNAAIIIQTHLRRYMARKKFVEQRNAAIVLQKNMRMFIAMKNYKNTMDKIVFLQTKIRATLMAKETRAKYIATKEATIVIQTQLRGHLARKKFLEQRNAAIILQKNMRMVIARRKFIQHKEERKLVMEKFSQMTLNHLSLIRIQRWWTKQLQIKKREKSAVVIQSCWRMKLAQKQVRSLREEKSKVQVIEFNSSFIYSFTIL